MPCPKVPKSPTPISDKQSEKGCIHWIDFDSGQNSISSQKARPWMIIGRNNYKSSRLIISPISDMKYYLEKGEDKLKYPYHAPLYKNDYSFLDKDSVVLLDQVYTISKDELCKEWYAGKINNLKEIDEAIMYNFDLFSTIMDTYKELISQLPNIHMTKYSRK